MPDGQRAKLIDGQIYYMAPPGLTHQRIVSYLHSKIYSYIESNAGSCEVLPAPFAVFLNDEDDTTYFYKNGTRLQNMSMAGQTCRCEQKETVKKKFFTVSSCYLSFEII